MEENYVKYEEFYIDAISDRSSDSNFTQVTINDNESQLDVNISDQLDELDDDFFFFNHQDLQNHINSLIRKIVDI